jgi:hypothetical protein
VLNECLVAGDFGGEEAVVGAEEVEGARGVVFVDVGKHRGNALGRGTSVGAKAQLEELACELGGAFVGGHWEGN